MGDATMMHAQIDSLKAMLADALKGLAAGQARELRLREALNNVGFSGLHLLPASTEHIWNLQSLARRALAIPPDDTALREMIEAAKAEERGEIEKLCEAYGTDKFSLYKGRPPYKGDEEGRASPYVDGQSDAAFDLACLISARGKA